MILNRSCRRLLQTCFQGLEPPCVMDLGCRLDWTHLEDWSNLGDYERLCRALEGRFFGRSAEEEAHYEEHDPRGCQAHRPPNCCIRRHSKYEAR